MPSRRAHCSISRAAAHPRGFAAFLALLTLLLAGCTADEPGRLRAGQPFPQLRLSGLDGSVLETGSLAGKVLVLNVWATWCPPCVEEMPSIQRLYEQLGPKGLRVVAVSIDDADADKVLDWARERELTFDLLHDRSAAIERTYQTTGVPESFVIDRNCVIIKKVIGAAEWDGPVTATLLRRLLDAR